MRNIIEGLRQRVDQAATRAVRGLPVGMRLAVAGATIAGANSVARPEGSFSPKPANAQTIQRVDDVPADKMNEYVQIEPRFCQRGQTPGLEWAPASQFWLIDRLMQQETHAVAYNRQQAQGQECLPTTFPSLQFGPAEAAPSAPVAPAAPRPEAQAACPPFPRAGQVYPSNRGDGSENDPYRAVWTVDGRLWQPNLPPANERQSHAVAVTLPEKDGQGLHVAYEYNGVAAKLFVDTERNGRGSQNLKVADHQNGKRFLIDTIDDGEAWALIESDGGNSGGFEIKQINRQC